MEGFPNWAPWWDVLAVVLLALLALTWWLARTARREPPHVGPEEHPIGSRPGCPGCRCGREAAVAVEAALVLPLLLLVTLGGLDLGLLVADGIVAQQVAGEACGAVAAGEAHAPALTPLTGGGWTVEILLDEAGWVEVEVGHSRPALAPFLGGERSVTRVATCRVDVDDEEELA